MYRTPSISGSLLKDVNQVLAENGLAFDNFGSIIIQTAGGYIGSGTHGTGGRTRILSSAIERMKLIDGTGTLHELDTNNQPEMFNAARVNLGCLGVVTELTFQCVDAFDLEEQLELVDFDRVLADLDTYIDNNDYLKLWWLPYTDLTVQIAPRWLSVQEKYWRRVPGTFIQIMDAKPSDCYVVGFEGVVGELLETAVRCS